MSSATEPQPQPQPQSGSAREPQREREVQRYLQSWQVAQGSSLSVAQNVDSIGAPEAQGGGFTPRTSPDKALTAFAQLAVLRLNVKRAMISLIDASSQIILTEATRNLNLGSLDGASPSDDKGNGLWLGTSNLKRAEAVCEHCLINTATARGPDGRTFSGAGLIVSDCRLDSRFESRPYVVAEPGVRFYAGVPIFSRNGLKIGTYSVSDDRPREGLTIDELQFMQGVAQATMEHLEWARDRVDRFKGERIVRGLASFIENCATVGDDPSPSKEDSPLRPPGMPLTGKQPVSRTSSVRHSKSSRRSSPAPPLPEGTATSPTQPSLRRTPPRQASPRQSPARKSRGPQNKSDEMVSMFQRASDLLRTSTLADGVVLFGASAASARQMGRVLKSGNVQSSDEDDGSIQATSGSEGAAMDSSDSDTSPNARPAKILAYSLADDRARADIEQGSALSLGTLEKYFSLFPKGKTFSFTDEGAGVSSEDDSASEREITGAGKRRKVRMDHKELFKKIPGAKAVVFVPLYDYTEDRLAGGCFLWTTVTGRIMNLDDDLSYLRAFGNSIMSQVGRINTQKNEAAKTTFIASMSHELRSPLHGILGAAEFLRDTPVSSYQSGLISSITTCGKTLLDTLNHVLDYSKINRLGRMQLRRSAKQNKLLKLSSDSLDSLNITAAVDLALLVEEVVDATSAGHSFKKAPDEGFSQAYKIHRSHSSAGLANEAAPVDGPVSVLLDIHPRVSWIVRTQPGALRRIIMNLFGNALKYTTTGSVHVSLRGQESANGSKVDILLKVVDTGKGMSDEFQRNRLFVPFSQEDSFQPGTGLGLSIVKQIVDSLGGTLEVKSQQHKGTEISVRLSLAPVDDPKAQPDEIIHSIAERTRGRQLILLESETNSPTTELQAHRIDEVLADTCAKWFGMKIAKEGDVEASEADIYLYSEPPSVASLEKRFNHSKHTSRRDRKVPIILVCLNAEEAVRISQNQTKVLTNLSEIVEVIPQPCGPRKLAKVFSQCLQMLEDKSGESGDGSITGFPRAQDPHIDERDDTQARSEDRGTDGIKHENRPGHSGTLLGLASPPPLDPGTPLLGSTPSPSGKASPQPAQAHGPTRHVLLVDDNKINLQLLVMFMKKCGFTYEEAENGLEAVERFQEASIPASQDTGPGRRSFDFVLMDISMPVMDGIEATKRIREFERVNQLPLTNVIALTGLASADAQRDAKSAGVDIFMPKPVRFAELKKLLTVATA